jgi:hypothetical protein
MVWHVCKTYKQPKSETGDLYARWFVWAKSPMTYGDFEGGDTYASEVRNYGRRLVRRYGTLVAADLEWQDAYDTRKVPTPAEYLQDA